MALHGFGDEIPKKVAQTGVLKNAPRSEPDPDSRMLRVQLRYIRELRRLHRDATPAESIERGLQLQGPMVRQLHLN